MIAISVMMIKEITLNQTLLIQCIRFENQRCSRDYHALYMAHVHHFPLITSLTFKAKIGLIATKKTKNLNFIGI
nr:hypothetical protein [Vibrio cholerae]